MKLQTEFSPWVWGFTTSSENWNGRLAMLGFLLTLLIEGTSGKGILHFIGLI
nr:high light inducible protein [Cryptomonas borealis]